jgi:hypothetical protein
MDFNQTHIIAPMCSIVVHHIFIFALSVRGSDRGTAHLDLCCNYKIQIRVCLNTVHWMFLYIHNPNNPVVILRFAILTSDSVDIGRSIIRVIIYRVLDLNCCSCCQNEIWDIKKAQQYRHLSVSWSEIQAPAKEAKTCISAFRLEDLRNVMSLVEIHEIH